MKFIKYLTILFSVILLSGCIGKEYDYNPPNASFGYSDIPMVKSDFYWSIDEGYNMKKTDIINLVKEQEKISVHHGHEDFIVFDKENFFVKDLTLFIWQGNEKKQLELDKFSNFKYPEETGEYILELNLVTKHGKAQYFANILVE